MNKADVGAVLRDGMFVVLRMGGPPLLIGLCVGLFVSLLQAVTQINEATLAFVPKVLAIGFSLAVLGPFMFNTLSEYMHFLIDHFIAIGGS